MLHNAQAFLFFFSKEQKQVKMFGWLRWAVVSATFLHLWRGSFVKFTM